MKVELRYVNSPEEECVVLQVCKNHPGIMKLQEIIEKGTYQTMNIPCFLREQRYSISCEHILYFETIQELLFVHTGSKVYEAKKRLYELEEMLPAQFARVSKSVCWVYSSDGWCIAALVEKKASIYFQVLP